MTAPIELLNTPAGARATARPGDTRAALELLGALVARELKGRYKGSVFGFLWAVLVPLFMAAIYVVFLRLLVGRAIAIESVIVGVFAWQYTAQCVQAGMVSVTGNANLVKKVFFPRALLPLSATLAQLVNYLLSLAVQFAVLTVLAARDGGGGPGAALAALPAAVAWQTLLNLGLALALSAAHVHFRDTQHLVGVLLSAWFFVSPVMYDMEAVAALAGGRAWVATAMWWNPMTALLTAARACALRSVVFPWTAPAAIGLAMPPIALAAGAWIFHRAQRHFADLL